MNVYSLIDRERFNDITAMMIGSLLALSWLEKSEDEAIEDNNDVVNAVNRYCELHGIPDKDKDDFLAVVNEYSLK